MANVTKSMENVAKTTLWQSNESSHLNFRGKKFQLISLITARTVVNVQKDRWRV